MSQKEIEVHLEFTPNPNSIKFVTSHSLIGKGTIEFQRGSETIHKSTLAQNIFAIPGIDSVMIGEFFVTVTKGETGSWDDISEKTPETIKTLLTEEQELVDPLFIEQLIKEKQQKLSQASGSIEQKICEILDREIRPAVAMDGGDITFEKFEEGKVYLRMQGACSSCPSSTMTLKMGVEAKLKEIIPEIEEVVSIN